MEAPSLVDVHWHPFEEALDPDTRGVMERARAAGVAASVAAGIDLATSRRVLDLSSCVPGLLPAVGLHPWFLQPPPDLADLAELAADPRVVAVGEIGLDGKIPYPMDIQERWFRDQLALARELGLPVVLHARGAVERVVAIAGEFPEVRGVLHSFPGGPDLALRMVDRGWCVSFSGALTRGNNRRGKHLARTLPDHGILVETDAPAIGLEGVMPAEVEPRHAARVAGTLAALRGCSPEDIARQTTGNAIRLFGPRLAGVLG